jgi:hypothetical protein
MKIIKDLFAILIVIIIMSCYVMICIKFADFMVSLVHCPCKELIVATSTPCIATSTQAIVTSTEIISKVSWYDYDLKGLPGYSKVNETAAARNYKRGEYVTVTNVANNKSVRVRINDYGPDARIHPDRMLDLSSHAFAQIADLSSGVILAKIK